MVEINSIKGAMGKTAVVKKAPKVKLTKEQALFVNDLVKIENRINVVREYITLWAHFFRFFADDLSEKEILAEEEKAFFQVMTQLARKQFLLAESMGDAFDRGNDLIGVLAMAVSLTNIQGMPENTRSKLELDWHTLYLDMNKSMGRLLRMLPGHLPLSEALAQLNKNGTVDPKALAKKIAADKKEQKGKEAAAKK